MVERISDDELFALIDNELTAPRRASLEARIAVDPELKARFDRLRETNATLVAAFPEPSDGADRLVRVVEAGFAKKGSGNLAFSRRSQDWPRFAAAAGLAIVGVGAFWLVGIQNPQASISFTQVEPGNPLYAAISSTPSGQTARHGEGKFVKPILSFQAENGQYCREIEFDHRQAASIGILCREGASWRTVVLIESEGAPDPAGGLRHRG
ncbi:MAG: hypothetical protein HC869_14740 [Rhodospirillales bacterium]|nr:hypothetical protein [Rhodospirillales bacterium]